MIVETRIRLIIKNNGALHFGSCPLTLQEWKTPLSQCWHITIAWSCSFYFPRMFLEYVLLHFTHCIQCVEFGVQSSNSIVHYFLYIEMLEALCRWDTSGLIIQKYRWWGELPWKTRGQGHIWSHRSVRTSHRLCGNNWESYHSEPHTPCILQFGGLCKSKKPSHKMLAFSDLIKVTVYMWFRQSCSSRPSV